MKRVTLAQVAELAGVSVMTASYTYNRPARVSDGARSKVLAAADRLGYAGPDPSARSLRRGSTRTLGVVLGEHLTYAFDDPQAVQFLAGIAEVCAGVGHGMTILPVTGAADDVPRIRAAAVDGFVVWTTADDDPVLAAVRSTRRPAVVHGGPSVDGLGLVSIDNRAAARAIGLIAFAGARRPAVLSFPLSRERISTVARGIGTDVLFPVTRARLEGYRDAALETGIAWSDVTVAVCSRNDPAEARNLASALFAPAGRPDAVAAVPFDSAGRPDLIAAGPPDAVAAMGDGLAAGVLAAARAAGLAVPEDVAVTGWDDAAVAAGAGLTTVAQSLRDQGAACARAALGEPTDAGSASWSIVVRGSTRPDQPGGSSGSSKSR